MVFILHPQAKIAFTLIHNLQVDLIGVYTCWEAKSWREKCRVKAKPELNISLNKSGATIQQQTAPDGSPLLERISEKAFFSLVQRCVEDAWIT